MIWAALLGGWRVGLAGLAAGLIMGGGGTWWLRDQMAAHGQLQQARVVTRTVIRQGAVTERVEYRTAQAQERVRTVTRTITQEIPHVVTVEIDRRFAVPVGLVRLHDAAALGLPPVPNPAGVTDDQPSPVTASQLTGAVVENYGTCNAEREQLIGLQSWITEQARVH